MLSKDIIESDKFLELPLITKLLYFYLNFSADDDGFVDKSKQIMRIVGATNDDIEMLKEKEYIIQFETGIIVITHWHIHNYIQKDRYKPTLYQNEKKLLLDIQTEDEKSTIYVLKSDVYKMDTSCIQNGYTGKERLSQVSNSSKEEIFRIINDLLKEYPNKNISDTEKEKAMIIYHDFIEKNNITNVQFQIYYQDSIKEYTEEYPKFDIFLQNVVIPCILKCAK